MTSITETISVMANNNYYTKLMSLILDFNITMIKFIAAS